MARDFYPFVEGTGTQGEEGPGTGQALVVRHAARIAVYDDPSAAPRVVVVEPKDVRPYLEEITATVTRLAKEQGGSIPFMVVREVVENFIHAYFIEPTISILDGGNTIRFSDQGPGIKEKDRALEYGTTSATEEMRHYIRGVGSGLPYAQQYMEDRGGSLTIEDNIAGGTVVTISTEPELGQAAVPSAPQAAPMVPQGQPWPQQSVWQQQASAAYQPYPAYQAYPPSPQPQGMPAWPQVAAVPQASWQQAGTSQQPWAQQGPSSQATSQRGPVELSLGERESLALQWLAQHEMVGPTELAAAYGRSQATWSRVLQRLDGMGLTAKQRGGQKHQLTDVGRAWMAGQGR